MNVHVSAKPVSRAVIVSGCALLLASSASAEFADLRSIFVDRFDYAYNSGNIASMTAGINNQMQAAADEGFTHVIWQVRGRADALYNSNYEPRASGLTPGFDPLQIALDAAHARGLKLHAWLNSTNLWQGSSTPPAGHIYHNGDPSFRIEDINGNFEPREGWSNYSSVNPILPEVHSHINNVVADIADNYAVDGIHLDYIRYIPGGYNFDRFPHDQQSHDMFFQETGLDGSNASNFSAYKSYIKERITDLVDSVKQTVDAAEISAGRAIDLSASVWRDPDVGRNDYMQDYGTWIEQELLDIAMPMIYLSESNDYLFNPNLNNSLGIRDSSGSSTRVAPTLAVYLHQRPGGGDIDLTLSQIDRARQFGADGVGFYDYPAFFDSQSSSDRQQIRDYFDPIVPPEPGAGNVIDDFEVDEGHFGWSFNISPPSQTNGLSTTTTIERVTTEAQTGSASQELNFDYDGVSGSWQIRHNSGIGAGLNANPAGNTPLPSTGYVGVWLKTSDSGVTVEIALDDPDSAERGVPQNVVADGLWHLYQWDLENPDDWNGWVLGDGDIDEAAVTIDSIFFAGTDDALIYMDNVSHNPAGPLISAPIPGDFNVDGNVNGNDLARWNADFGISRNGRGLLDWQRHADDFTVAAETAATAAPEPQTLILALLGALPLRRGKPSAVGKSHSPGNH